MMYRHVLLATVAVLCAGPALAVVDPPASSQADSRMRSVVYDRNNPVQVYAAPGATLRLVLGADEKVVGVLASDQGAILPDEEQPDSTVASSAAFVSPSSGAPKLPPSCDGNLCRNVTGNIVYLKPLRVLNPQPLFVQTMRCIEPGKCDLSAAIPVCQPDVCETVPYTFEIATRPGDLRSTTPNTTWSITFTYPDRDRRAAALEAQRKRAAWLAAARERAALTPPPPSVASLAANRRYGYKGSAATQPDDVWDDGRTTFMRFNGNRRVPNVYRREPNGDKALSTYAVEPDAGGNTIRIAHTDRKWWVEDGDGVGGCVLNASGDPEGATATTVKVGAR